MSTNGYTREFILERASELASQVGLTGLSVGAIAREMRRPKSTVFFHFRSMEQLHLAVLESAAHELIREVVRPAFLMPDGLPRLARLFERWLAWDGKAGYPGGCLFVATATEFDDRPGPVRDHLVRRFQRWHQLLAGRVHHAVADGTFRPDTDRDQFLHDLLGVMLSYHHAQRLFRDPDAERRARRSFQELVGRAKGERSRPAVP
jgi:AcrR family transcriptional regulator